MNMNKIKILNILIIVLTIEKSCQHLLTALFFFVEIPGIGTPGIGSNFIISNNIMGILNVLYFIGFCIGLYGYLKNIKWGLFLIITLAVLDIFLEFIFHHFFFITLSVIVSIILTTISIWYLKITNSV